MKKHYLILITCLSFFLVLSTRVSALSSYPECDEYYNQKESNFNSRLASSYDDPDRETYYNNYKSNSTLYTNCTNQQYQIKLQEAQDFSNFFQQGYSSYADKDYLSAANYFEQASEIKPNDSSTKTNLLLCYWNLGYGYFSKKDFDNSIEYFLKYLNYKPNDYDALHNVGLAYINKEDYDNALTYFEKALAATFNKAEIDEINSKINRLNGLKKDAVAKENAKTNDPLNYEQYYLEQLNIYEAQKSITNWRNVVIAVIDDGININHPDLSKSIWTNQDEIPGNKKDDDKNGYIDDYNGWNFVYNSNNVLPLGVHGTMVAGIIGASINNYEGIAGITPNVKIMPIGVLDANGETTNDRVIKAIKYAMSNGANIINLSLGGSQFIYSDVYDSVIKQAYDKGIIIVVAGGNGDVLSYQTEGVNTNTNKISPVCNEEGNKKRIIGVGAFDEEGYRARRSNYGENGKGCVDFYAPGVNILSTSIMDTASDFGINYNKADGTSFSTPMIVGIIGLGYNQFGSKLTPDRAYDGLTNSLVANSVGNYVIDAAKFIEVVNTQIKEEEKTPNQRCEEVYGKNVFSDGGGSLSNGYDCYCKKGYVWNTGMTNCTYMDINKELVAAISWMYEMGLTTYGTVNTFMGEDYLTREQASKFFVEFAKKVLKKTVDGTKKVSFKDIKKANITLQPYIKEANQLGLFNGINGNFLPFNKLTRAQAMAVIIRAMDGIQNEKDGKWYSTYNDHINEYGMDNGLGFGFEDLDSINIKRGEVALFLYRAYLNKDH